MGEDTRSNFIEQQGYLKADAASCTSQYSALMFQPWIVGLGAAVALVTQSAWLFLSLSTVLFWSALVPRWNPFEALYNALVTDPREGPPLGPAPAPRRFAQGMAAAFMLGIGLCLLSGRPVWAWLLEGLLVAALALLLFGRFCVGSYLYHVITGNRAFANRTLPWKRG